MANIHAQVLPRTRIEMMGGVANIQCYSHHRQRIKWKGISTNASWNGSFNHMWWPVRHLPLRIIEHLQRLWSFRPSFRHRRRTCHHHNHRHLSTSHCAQSLRHY